MECSGSPAKDNKIRLKNGSDDKGLDGLSSKTAGGQSPILEKNYKLRYDSIAG